MLLHVYIFFYLYHFIEKSVVIFINVFKFLIVLLKFKKNVEI